MKKYLITKNTTVILIFVAAFDLIVACNEQEKSANKLYHIYVETTFDTPKKIYVAEWVQDNMVVRDSAAIIARKAHISLANKGFYKIYFNNIADKKIVLDTSAVTINIDGSDAMPIFTTQNTATIHFDAIEHAYDQFQSASDDFESQYILYANLKNEDKARETDLKIQFLQTDFSQKIKNIINNANSTLVKAYGARFINMDIDFVYLDSLSDTFTASPDSNIYIVKNISNKILSVKKIQKGSLAPDFTLATYDGRQISLSDYRGKYLLLDFWASWCPPCRAQNPDLVILYNKYKSKNFDILSVSLDNDRDKWKNAVQHDGLSWTQVSDLNEWDSKVAQLYGVEAIPHTILIDTHGKILAKGIQPQELESMLQKLLLLN
ncbi:MAG: TlpA disulfide reductase family protein [Cytophagales bacterium]|nr:TlpA disulfide reductase family protein [Cytophagales bacterium]